jgi:peptidoglycan/LPS O-acetylase OafA/YrhL
MLPVAIIYAGNDIQLNFDFLMRWILLRPIADLFPFPIGQIWFICSLLLLAFLSFPLFIAQQRTKQTLLVSLIVCMVITTITSLELLLAIDINFFFLPSYMVYETLSLAPFFLFGAYYISNRVIFDQKLMTMVGMVVLFISLMIDVTAKKYGYFEFTEHRPNTYIYQSFGVLLILMGLQSDILKLLDKTTLIKACLLHCNKHAYSIFLIHIPILVSLEYVFGWHDLSNDILMAMLRLIAVVVLSLTIAIPISSLHKYLTQRVVRLLT